MNTTQSDAFVITGPTSGIGRATALQLAKHGTLVLVGRDRAKLDELRATLESRGQRAVSVVCDLSDLASVRTATGEIDALELPIAGVLNNAGIQQLKPTKNARGWDMSFATNHLGPFAFTEALIPHLRDGAHVLFVASAVEDPERGPAKVAGFRGGRYISADASARGEWMAGGAKIPGFDAYATTKQAVLVAALELAKENPRLRINAIEPGFNPATGLGRDANAVVRFLARAVTPILPLFIKGASTSKRAARVLTHLLTAPSSDTGVYYDEKGSPMMPSAQARDPQFRERVVAETRAFLRASSLGSNPRISVPTPRV